MPFDLNSIAAPPTEGRACAQDYAVALLSLLFAALVRADSPIGRELDGLLNTLDNHPEDKAWKFFPALQRLAVGAGLTQIQKLKEKVRGQLAKENAAKEARDSVTAKGPDDAGSPAAGGVAP